MKFYDLHLKGKNFREDHQLLKEAQRLGYTGVAIIYPDEYYENSQETIKKLIGGFRGFEVVRGVSISAETPKKLKRKVQKFRKKAEIILVEGGDAKINRAACENTKVDILSKPYNGRRDPGINHILARTASENNVAIELNTKDIINSYLKVRARLFEYFTDIIKLQRKFNFPIIIASGATTIYDLRTPRDLIALFKCIKIEEKKIIEALSTIPESIIKFNKERDSMIIIGVKKLER